MSGDCGCGCGGASKVAMAQDSALTGAGFVRPRFFGGMLLTEDDLQAAIEYSIAKRRLTNRHVIGAGVVCGLDVAAHACEPGIVVVQPGYAIDCCGNDLLVSCPEEVNIIDLARDLRRRTGVDCGEPCDEQSRQEYHLYLRYAETLSAPVAPYAPDDCGTGECEFSRVSEGYRFELRCDGPEDVETLLDALRACRPTDEDVDDDTKRMVTALSLIARRGEIEKGLPAVKAPTATEFKKAFVDPDKPEAGVNLIEGVELVNRTLAVLARESVVKGAPNRRELITRTEEFATQLRSSKELAALPADEQARIVRTLETATNRPDFAVLSDVDRGWVEVGLSAGDAQREFVASAGAVQISVLRRLAQGSDDYRVVRALRFDSLAEASSGDVVRLAREYLKSVEACTCAAFSPPCPTCTDDAVALAKVRIDGCDVVEVCALDRRWVLSPRALSYWFPIVETLREQLELVCCGDDEKPTDKSFAGVARASKLRLEGAVAQTAGARDTQAKVAALKRELEALSKQVEELKA